MCNVYYIHMVCLLSIRPVACYNPDDSIFRYPLEYPVLRIGNGTFAVSGQFPYQVSLSRPTNNDYYDMNEAEFTSFCGGAIIHHSKVLTAAQCIVVDAGYCEKLFAFKPTVVEPKDIYAIAGTLKSHEYYKRDNDTQWRKVQKGYAYPGFRYPFRNIAILVVDQPYLFNEYVGELPVATVVTDYSSSINTCLVAGFGKRSETASTVSEKLLWAYVDVLQFHECAVRFQGKMNTANFICSDDKYSNVYMGDTGGALVCYNTSDPADDGQGVIVGVVSGIIKCSKLSCGTLFTRVTSYKKMFSMAVTNKEIAHCYSFFIIFYFYQNLISIC